MDDEAGTRDGHAGLRLRTDASEPQYTGVIYQVLLTNKSDKSQKLTSIHKDLRIKMEKMVCPKSEFFVHAGSNIVKGLSFSMTTRLGKLRYTSNIKVKHKIKPNSLTFSIT